MINLINGIILKPKLEEHLPDKIIDLKEVLHFRVETPDLWVVMVGQGVHRQGSMEIRDKHLVRQVVIREIQVSQVVNPGQAVPPQQQQAVVRAGPQAGGEVPGETLRSVELPKLDRNATSLDFGDWLTVVQQMIGDVSYTSAQWWGVVMTAVEQAYHHWLQADPLMRLRMAPVIPDKARGWPRTENRVVGMLLQAVPKDIYEDIVANRQMSAGQVMFKLYTIFQPGGQVERTSLLQMLVDWKGQCCCRDGQLHPEMEKVGSSCRRTSISFTRSSGFGRSGRKNE